MFKHPNLPTQQKPSEEKQDVHVEQIKDTSPAALRELLEKNLKWSQIIYEQNRRINSKLFWAAIGGWIKALIIIAPIILAVVFLPPLFKKYVDKYLPSVSGIIGTKSGQTGSSAGSLDEIFKLLPLNSAQKEQLKAVLK